MDINIKLLAASQETKTFSVLATVSPKTHLLNEKIHVNDLMLLGNQGQTRLYFKHVLCKCIFFNSQTLNRYWLAAVDQEHGGKEDGFNPCNCLNRD